MFHGLKSPKHDDIIHNLLGSDFDEYRSLARKASRNPETLEEKLIHDANLLDALGIVGLVRAFVKGGYEKQSIEETMTIIEENMRRPMLTEIARELSEPKIKYMDEFLSTLEKELALLNM